MSDWFSKAECYFETVDNDDGSFWLTSGVASRGQRLTLEGQSVGIGLDLNPNISIEDADELARLLRKHVTHVRVWRE